MTDLLVRCQCGSIQGVARDVSPQLGNRVVCYCESCQQFPAKLGKADDVLDEYGGTDIYQIPAGLLTITQGLEHLRCLRHTPKGLYRFYAGCCNTPFANSPGTGMPFVGLLQVMDAEPGARDKLVGPVRAHVNTHEATKTLPPERKFGLFAVILRLLGQMVRWRITGQAKPHPFFDESGLPVVEPEIR